MRFDELVEAIQDYESDTFSAEGAQITLEEAKRVAHRIIERAWNHVDGVSLDEFLYDVREESY